MRFAAFGLCLLAGCGRSGVEPGSFCASAEHVQAAFINVSRSTNAPAVAVVVYCDGSADRVLDSSASAGLVPKTFPANSPEVLKFLDDLDAVGDVSAIPASPVGPGAQSRCPKSVSFGTVTTVTAGGKTSGDMECLINPTAAEQALATDCATLAGP